MTRWSVLFLCLFAGCGKQSLISIAPTMRPGVTVIVSDKSGGHLLMAKTERELLRAGKLLDDDDDRIDRMLDDDRAMLISGRHSATLLSNRGKYFQLDIELLNSDFKPFTYRGYVLQSEATVVAATPELSAAVAGEFEAKRKKSIIEAKREPLNPGKPGDVINVTGRFNRRWDLETKRKDAEFSDMHYIQGTRHGVLLDLSDDKAHIIIDNAAEGAPPTILEGHVWKFSVIIEKDEIPLNEALRQAKLAIEEKPKTE